MRRILLAGGVAVLVLALVGAGAYVYFFSGLRSSPRALSAATVSPGTGSTVTPAALAGRWTVTQGSLAGYRVREQFVNQSSPHEAVARTSDVSGGFAVQAAGGELQASGVRFTAAPGGLQSVDQVAGFNVTQRDRFVSRTLEVSRFPEATFTAQPVALPASLARGGTASATIPGQLTVHGVTRPVQVKAQARLNGGALELSGSTVFDMSDFGLTAPQVPFTRSESGVTLEFQLRLTRSGA